MESIQQVLAVFGVLAALGGTLYWLRHKGMAQISLKGISRNSRKRMQSIERLALTPQHSLHLVSVGSRVLLVAVSPGGCSILENAQDQLPLEDRMVPQ